MNKILVTVVLGVATVAAAQPPAQPAQGQTTTAPASTAQAPVIKDPAEYNAYVGAITSKDPAAQISGLEAFLTQYPNSIMKPQALEILMGAYQQTGNPKVMDAASRLLTVNPDNIKALVVLAFSERAAQKWADAEKHAQHGLEVLPNWTKPDGVSDADFTKQKAQFGGILNSVAGFSALQLKDFATAQKYLRAAVEADPNNVENIYPLAVASLPPSTPPDEINGLFFIARASNLIADPTAKAQVTKFGRSKAVYMNGTVIKATATEIDIAASEDDIEAKKADITLNMAEKLLAARIPKEGASLDFQGEPASYTPNPFMMTMEKGVIPKPKVAPKPPVHHKPATN
jgi:tetratricopeptide (TPR) repeat protein